MCLDDGFGRCFYNFIIIRLLYSTLLVNFCGWQKLRRDDELSSDLHEQAFDLLKM